MSRETGCVSVCQEAKSGSTQNRTGVLRTKTSYAAPTPWNHITLKEERGYILVVELVFMGVSSVFMCGRGGEDVWNSFREGCVCQKVKHVSVKNMASGGGENAGKNAGRKRVILA